MSSARKRGRPAMTKLTTVKSVATKKTTTQKNRKRHPCTICGKDFDKKDRLQRHLEKFHSEDVQCDVCKKWFDAQNLLEEHSKIHRPPKRSRLQCKECPHSFIKQRTLVTHMRKFHKLFKCQDCEEYFTQLTGLKAHRNACHSLSWLSGVSKIKTASAKKLAPVSKIKTVSVEKSPSKHDCEFCGRSFVKETASVSHMTLFHRGLKCPKCDIWCGGKNSLVEHIKTCKKKPTIKFFTCHLCKKKFANVNTLSNHIKPCHAELTKTNEMLSSQRPVTPNIPNENKSPPVSKCKVCSKCFPSKAALSSHLDYCLHKFKCSICGKDFATEKALSYHVRIFHTGEKPYQCNKCQKRFPHSNILKVHIAMVHQPNNLNIAQGVKNLIKKKLHKCRICRKGFRQYSFLKMHMKIHTTEKQLKCGICGERFSTDKAIIEHINIFHLEDIGNTENVEYVVECVNTDGESWDGEGAAASTTDEAGHGLGQVDTETYAPASVVNPIHATSEQMTHGAAGGVPFREIEQQQTWQSHLNIQAGTCTGTVSTSMMAKDSVQESLHPCMNFSGDQTHLNKNYIPQAVPSMAVEHPQGESEHASSHLQYNPMQYCPSTGHDGIIYDTSYEPGEGYMNADSNMLRSVKCESHERLTDREKVAADCETQCIELGPEEDFYIVVNNDCDEEEKIFLVDAHQSCKRESDQSLPRRMSDQLHLPPTCSQDLLEIQKQLKQEKQTLGSGRQVVNVGTEVIENPEFTLITPKIEGSTISARTVAHGSHDEEYAFKENFELTDQTRTAEPQYYDSGLSYGSKSVPSKCVSVTDRMQHLCGICQQGFLSSEDLHHHKVSSHSLRCTQCGEEYMRMIDLVTHYEACRR